MEQQSELTEVKPKKKYNYTKKTGRPKEGINQRLGKLKLKVGNLAILYRNGFTDAQVAEVIGVEEVTIKSWKKLDEFRIPIKDWKEEADAKVEKSLYKKAIGYEYDEVTYEQSKVGGLALGMTDEDINFIKHTPTAKTKVVTKQFAPDTLAIIFWLKNRKPEEWKDKSDLEHSGNLKLDLSEVLGEASGFRNATPSAN